MKQAGLPVDGYGAEEEEAAERVMARLGLLLGQVPAVLWTTDSEFTITSVLGSVLDPLDINREQIVGKSLEAFTTTDESLIGPLEAHRRACANRESVYFEVTRAGRTYECCVKPFSAPTSDEQGCLGVAIDVTRRVESERDLEEALADLEQRVEQRTQALSAANEKLQEAERELCLRNRALKAERKRYQELFDGAPDGYLITDPSGTILQANQTALQMLGVSEEEIVAGELEALLVEHERAAFQSRLKNLSEEGRIEDWETEIRSANQEVLYSSVSARAVRSDKRDEVVGLRWSIRDITERRKAIVRSQELLAETELQRERAKELARETDQINSLLCAVIDTMPTGLIVCDDEGTILMTNPMGEELLGRVFEDSVRRLKSGYALHRPDGCTLPLSDLPIWLAIKTGEISQDVEIEIRYPDGRTQSILAAAAPVFVDEIGLTNAVMIFQDITQRRRVAEERKKLLVQVREDREEIKNLAAVLERERNILEIIMENTQAHLAYLDPDFDFIRVNSTYVESTGYDEWDLIGENHFELFPDDGNREVFERVRDTGEAVHFQARPYVYADRPELGTTYWNWSLVPVHGIGGEVQGLVLSLLDVTERERTRRELSRYADRLRVLHELDRAILVAQSVEEVAEAALRYVPQLVACRRASVAEFDREKGEARLLAVYDNGETAVGEDWCGAFDECPMLSQLEKGEPYVVEDLEAISDLDRLPPLLLALREESVRGLIALPLQAHGALIGSLNFGLERPGRLTEVEMEFAHDLVNQLAIGIYQERLHQQVQEYADMLEHRVVRRTAELRASERRFRTIFEESALGIALVDVDGQVLESNPALREMLGYNEEELRGKHFWDVTHEDDLEKDQALYQDLIDGKRDHYRIEKRYVRKDGESVWAELFVSLVRGSRERPRFSIAMVKDITKAKEAQAALIQAEKLAISGKLAASFAHEINNPLQTVIGCLGLAEETLVEGGDVGRYLSLALEELRRAAGIVSQLRDLNRRSELRDRQPTDLNVLIERVLALSEKNCERHQIEVEWERKDLPHLLLGADQVQQVFLNMVINAIDAMPNGGKLRVRTEVTHDPEGVSVMFEDNGVGISPEEREHLFDPFYSTKSDGVGLGLYISGNIVDQHRGRIDIDSAKGEGTTFTIWLPRVRGEES